MDDVQEDCGLHGLTNRVSTKEILMELIEKTIHESLSLFSLKGYLKTSIDDIVERFSLSRGGPYNLVGLKSTELTVGSNSDPDVPILEHSDLCFVSCEGLPRNRTTYDLVDEEMFASRFC